jgi:hypothetical protein
MSLAARLQTLYGWTPNYRLVLRKPVPTGLEMTKVPQSNGISGWIVLTYDNAIPVCLWISAQECRKIPCIVDERLCGDTFLKVEKVGPLDFVVADIWVFNSNCVFACSTFQQRYEWLPTLLKKFTSCVPGVTANLVHKSGYAFKIIKGYEHHTNETPGKQGYFEEGRGLSVVKSLNISDCFEVNGKGYLRVPDLKTSEYLRSKSKEFEAVCSQNEDGSWTLVENIPDVD